MTVLPTTLLPIATTFGEFWEGIPSPDRPLVLLITLLIVASLVMGVAASAARVVNTVHRRRVEADLKQDMLDRGMSVDEIERMIKLTADSDNLCPQPGKKMKQGASRPQASGRREPSHA